MYEIFEQLLKSNNLTAYKVSLATGISQATLSDWKNGKTTPKTDKLQKIAEFFGVSVNYLMGKDDEPKDENLRILERAYHLMPEDKRQAMVNTCKSAFGDYFDFSD